MHEKNLHLKPYKLLKVFALCITMVLLHLDVQAQDDGDYRSIGGALGNPNQWFNPGTWEKFDGANWNPSTDVPLSGDFSGTVYIQAGTFVEYEVNSLTDGFDLEATVIIDGNFLVNIPTNSNTNYAGDVNVFELNDGGVFRTTFGNNPKLEVRVRQLFRINGGELRYQSGNNNSALYIECKGDVEVNGGLVINDTNRGLNDSGLYMSGNGTQANPQHLKISSNVSTIARERFFATSSTYIVEEYAGAIEQNTVFGDITDDIRSGYIGLQDKGNVLTINNSSSNGVNLSRSKTISDTLRLLGGTLNKGSNTLNIATGATIERSGGNLDEAPTSFGSSVNLLYSDFSSAVTMGDEVPATDIIENFTISNTSGVIADRDFTVNGTLDLAVANPNATNGLLELVRDYTGYAQTPYGSANFADSTHPSNDLDSYTLTMGSSASTTGIGDVTGKIRRANLVAGTTYDFGHNNTRLTFNSVNGSAIPSAVSVLVSRGDFGEHIDNGGSVDINGFTANRNSVKRLYQIQRQGGGVQSRFTVRFAYQEDELNANEETELITWDHHLPYFGLTPHEHGRTSFSNAENYVELSNHSVFYLAEEGDTEFTKYWMLSEKESEGDYVWLGAVDIENGWNSLSNWNGGRVPDETANVTIPSSDVYGVAPRINLNSGFSEPESTEVITGEGVRMRTLEIAGSALLEIVGGQDIFLYGGPNVDGDGINFSTIASNGTINPGESTVHLLDDATASSATISGTVSLHNLVVSDNANLDVLSDAVIDIQNSLVLNSGASVDATTQPNTIRYTGEDQTIAEIGGYHTLDLSSTGTTVLPANLDIHGDLLVNQSTGLDLSSVDLSFLGGAQSIQSVLSNLSLGSVTLDNSDAITTTVNTLDISDLKLINGVFEVESGANLILSSLLSRTNGHLGGNGTIELAGPTDIDAGLFQNDIHEGSLTLNILNEDFSIVDGFEVKGNLNLTEANVPLGTQTLKLGGNLTKTNGSIDASQAVIEFTGADSQSIASEAFANNTVSQLVNSGAGGPNLNNELNVTDLVQVNSGTIQSNDGNLVLKSDASKTAFVGPIGINGDITGEVMVERFIPAKRAFRFFASPVTSSTSIRENWQEGGDNSPGFGTHITGAGGSANGFDPTNTNNSSFYKFNNTTGVYDVVTNTNVNTLEVGDGYYLLVRGDRTIDLSNNQSPATETIIRTKGVLQKGNYSPDNISDADGLNFKLIGNPYQSPVDMTEVLSASQSNNLNFNFYWVWDVKVNERGGFVAVDLSDGSNNNPVSSANQFLQASQSFFIQTDDPDVDGSITSLVFSEASKNVNQLNTGAYGPIVASEFVEDSKRVNQKNNDPNGQSSTSIIKKMKIDLLYADQSIEDENVLDGTIIKFNDNYTNAIDLTDAAKLFVQDEEIATTVEGVNLSIQSRLNPVVDDIIEIDISKQRNLNYALRIDAPKFDGLEMVLKDKYTGEQTLIDQNSHTVYYYTIDNDASALSDRFEILFQEITLSTGSDVLASDIQLYPNPNKGNFNVVLPSSFSGSNVVIFSAMGQKVYENTLSSKKDQLEFNLEGSLSSGIYFLQLEIDSKTIVKKIIVN